MTSREEKGGDGGRSQSRGGREAPARISISSLHRSYCLQDILLSQVDLLMPLSPDLGGCEHTARTAHVSKSSLTSTVCTSS